MFQISDKVVCVDDQGWRPDLLPPTPHKGVLYVVQGDTSPEIWGQKPNPNLPAPDQYIKLIGMDGAWHPSRFRKLSDIKAENALKAQRSNQHAK